MTRPADNAGGGAGATPGTYAVIGSYADTLVQQDGTVVAALTVKAIDSQYNVWFQITIPDATWNAAAEALAAGDTVAGATTTGQALIGMYAGLIQAFMLIPSVSQIVYLQQVDQKTGLFTDNLLVTVTDPTGALNASIVVPLDPNQEANSNNAILATYTALTALAATT